MIKVSVIQPDLNIGCAYPVEFVSSAEALDITSEQYTILGDITIKGDIVHTGKAYKVEGMIYFRKAFRCDYCLENFEKEQEFSFSEEYRRKEAEGANENLFCFNGDYIDITELIRETILLYQPLNQICSPDCRGLCMKCGANLNEAECGCDRHIIDPRLAELQKLFK